VSAGIASNQVIYQRSRSKIKVSVTSKMRGRKQSYRTLSFVFALEISYNRLFGFHASGTARMLPTREVDNQSTSTCLQQLTCRHT
jgi:hypothetical protein